MCSLQLVTLEEGTAYEQHVVESNLNIRGDMMNVQYEMGIAIDIINKIEDSLNEMACYADYYNEFADTLYKCELIALLITNERVLQSLYTLDVMYMKAGVYNRCPEEIEILEVI
jgi:hypothetical protein